VYETSCGDLEQVETYLSSYHRQRELGLDEYERLHDVVALRGWIALHGTLLTEEVGSERAARQFGLLQHWLVEDGEQPFPISHRVYNAL
jgi:hypothetical protein